MLKRRVEADIFVSNNWKMLLLFISIAQWKPSEICVFLEKTKGAKYRQQRKYSMH